MSKRTYSQLGYDNETPYYPIYSRRTYAEEEQRRPAIEKRQKKVNSFHVDSLLAEKTSKRIKYEDRDLLPPVTIGRSTSSAFQRLYANEERGGHIRVGPTNQAALRKCKKSCCVPEPTTANFSKYPARIHTYRSRESGSADSVGSSCNSYEHSTTEPVRYPGKQNGYPDDRSHYREYKELRFPYEYKRTDYNPYEKVNVAGKEKCACADCNNNREFYHEERDWVRKPAKMFYLKEQESYHVEAERKPLSKRKALLNELELKVLTKTDMGGPSLKPPPSPTTDGRTADHATTKNIKEEIVDENFESVINDKANDDEIQAKSEELLQLPAGANRNRAVANLLERRRVAELNNAFERLRTIIPCYGNEDRTLSKIKTLKYALTYISHLMAVSREQSTLGYFHTERDFKKLSRHDPLISKCREHMSLRKVL